MPSTEYSVKQNIEENNENLAEIQITLSQWLKRDLGIQENIFHGNHIDGGSVFLQNVYLFCKRDIATTRRFLYKYFKSRCCNGLVDIYHNRNSESDEILKSCQAVYLFSLPQQTKRGHRIIVIKLANSMAMDDFDPKAFYKRFIMMSDIRFHEGDNTEKDVYIIDMEGFTRQHAIKVMNSGATNKFFKNLMDSYPRRVHAVHLIRAKFWQRNSIGVWLKMLGASKKMSSRVRSYARDDAEVGALDQQLQYVSGRIQDLNDIWTKKLISYSSWFASQEALYKSTEPKIWKMPAVNNKSSEENPNESRSQQQDSDVYIFTSLEGTFRSLET